MHVNPDGITPRALWPNWIEPDHPDRRSQEPAAATMASHMTDSNVRPEPLPNRAVSAHGDAIVLIPVWTLNYRVTDGPSEHALRA
jgi:hypothetical protein